MTQNDEKDWAVMVLPYWNESAKAERYCVGWSPNGTGYVGSVVKDFESESLALEFAAGMRYGLAAAQ